MQFNNAKKGLKEILDKEIDIIRFIIEETKRIRGENLLFAEFDKENFIKKLEDIYEMLNENGKTLDRTKMKCVTFGNTSNGKSAVLNALLKERVLPSSLGHVTSCFISIEGYDRKDGYIKDKYGKIRDISEIGRFASASGQEKYHINDKVEIFWPRSRCDILKEEVQIIDSPGIDYSVDNDNWINGYCKDADVFLLVIDGMSSLNKSEMFFFIRLHKILVIPSIIFVINKWDLTKQYGEDERNSLRYQHENDIKKCFVENMNLYSDKEFGTKKRIFFISAKNALPGSDEDQEEAEQFKKFEILLKEDLRSNAIERKLKGIAQRISESAEIVSKCFEELKCFRETRQQEEDGKNTADECIKQLAIDEIFETCQQFCDQHCIWNELAAKIRKKKSEYKVWSLIKYYYFSDYGIIQKWISSLFQSLADEINERFKCDMKNLEDRLKESLKKNSIIETKDEDIQKYLNRYVDIDEIVSLASNNVRDVLDDIRHQVVEIIFGKNHGSSSIARALVQEIEDLNERYKDDKRHMRERSNALFTCGDNDNKDNETGDQGKKMEEDIANVLREYFKRHFKIHLSLIGSMIIDRESKCKQLFMNDQRELVDLHGQIEDKRCCNGKIIEELEAYGRIGLTREYNENDNLVNDVIV